MKVKLLVALTLAIIVSLPSLSMGNEKLHYFDCAECHLSGGTLDTLITANVCIRCHSGDGFETTLNAGSRYNSVGTHLVTPEVTFDAGDASHFYGNNPLAPAQTSHHWAISTTYNAASGSSEPNRTLYPNMYSRYNVSTGKLTCTRCHDPHGDYATNPKLLRLSADNLNPMTENELCEACHSDFANTFGAVPGLGNKALMTHPIMDSVELNAAISGNPTAFNMAGVQNYNSAAPYANSAVLIEGGVSCSSCHGPHFTDSNSSTVDGPALPLTGDGLLLRSDGPTSNSAVIYNGVTNRYNTAQLRSNLCQDCHTYKMHGDPAYNSTPGSENPNHNIGCLDCHGGHSYNGGTPSLYVLSDKSPDDVPIRFQKNFASYNSVTYPLFNSVTTRTEWADNVVGTATGFCEVCHGDVNDPAVGGLANSVDQHKTSGGDECSNCHTHGDTDFSFKLDASAASCGDCHGFPPYKDIRGDRAAWYDARDGGYAYYNALTYGYNGATYYKDETKTAHKTHAGRDLKSGANTAVLGADGWYFVGSAGIDNCTPCHGPDAGKDVGGHKIDPGTDSDTFRNIDFATSAIANGFGNVAGTQYNADAGDDCSNVYCHSSGAPRTGPTGVAGDRDWTAGLGTTPVWVGNGGAGGDGFDSITNVANTSRCQTCHGNDVASMTTKQNTFASHGGHFNSALMNIGTNCNICHANTAMDNETLTANATDQRPASGGQHVNGVQDVSYNATILYNALAGETYDPQGDGTCSVYCHDVPDPVNTTGKGRTADWDVAGSMTCNSCHDDQTTNFTGSHQEHSETVGNGPRMACAECHGAGSDTGVHTGHLDGAVTYIALTGPEEATWGSVYPQNFCDKCHGFDAENGEVQPLWGEDLTLEPGKYCATCHAGPSCGGSFDNGLPQNPPSLDAARTGGHNRLAASGPYPVSGNPAADLNCDDCHVTDSPKHFDGGNYKDTGLEADLLLRTAGDDNFTAYFGAEDDFCNNCHSDAPGSSNPGTAGYTRGMVTHRGKLCVACHTVHGDSVGNNIQMIWSDDAEQKLHDASPGTYDNVNVVFVSNNVAVLGAGDTPLGEGSFDEDDGAAGVADENAGNNNDLCTVCHIAAGIGHNRRDGADNQGPTGHNIESTCTSSCHTAHNDAIEAFVVAAGDSCDDCHGYPPSLAKSALDKVGAHGDGTNLHARRIDADGIDVDKDLEDRTDCAYCHTGADLYTYSLTDDAAAGGARANHGAGDVTQLAVLVNSVGFNSGDGSCSTACHNSDAADGFWTDTAFAGNGGDGLDCNACHYYEDPASASGNALAGAKAVSTTHDEHFEANKGCAECHNVEIYNSATFSLSHINGFDFGNGADANDGLALEDMATASLDEAEIVRGAMVYSAGIADGSGSNNTCSNGGFAAGCHASGGEAGNPSPPDWDVAIPATGAGCEQCHTNTTTATYNPTSGLHDNTQILTVTGNAHDGNFDDGSAGTADCVTCHTALPSSAHADGNLNSATVTINSAIIATYNATNLTCATSCHSVGTTWTYNWSTTVYNSTGAECANCHGDFASGWNAGVTPHIEVPTKGDVHSAAGSETYPCTDCHAIGSASGYTYNSVSADWNANAGETSNHGDNWLTMNQPVNSAITFDTGRVGCTNSAAGCHNAGGISGDNAHSFPETTTGVSTQTVAGDTPVVECFSCHGGYFIGGTDKSGYWPNGSVDNSDEKLAGKHLVHITALANSVYNGATLTDLLTNDGNGFSHDKQIALCEFCHDTPGGANHKNGLPANVNSMYGLWDKTKTTLDNGVYSSLEAAGNDTCATVDCHFNKTTPETPTDFGWYGGATSECIMCHTDITDGGTPSTTGFTHVAHKNSATLYGRGAVCADCHDSATDWALNNPPNDGNHLSGGLIEVVSGTVIDGSTAIYNPATGCGANACHNDGTGAVPVDNTYQWTDSLSNCNFCHLDPPATGAHTEHMGSTTYVDCIDCHTPGDDVTNHIRGSVTYNTTTITEYPTASGAGSCTNSCHIAGDAGDWTGGFTGLACADCHNTSAFLNDGGPYLPTSGLHVTYNIVTSPTHNGALLGGNCINCHDGNAPVSTTEHGNGVFNDAATITYNFNSANVASYDSANGCMATDANGCHTDNADWRRQWNGFVDEEMTGASAPGNPVCGNCHGAPTTFDDPGQWNWDEANATTMDHTDPVVSASNSMDEHSVCKTCHGWTDPNYDIATYHRDGFITMNGPESSATGAQYNSATGLCGAACHTGSEFNIPGNANSGWTENYDDFGAGGSCDACHGAGTGNFWPQGINGHPDDDSGMHGVHMNAMSLKGIGGQVACGYCHVDPYGANHADGKTDMANVAPYTDWNYKRIIGGGDDKDGVFYNSAGVGQYTCSTIDCHFNNSNTPHWYGDTTIQTFPSGNVKPNPIAPTRALLVEPGPNPGSLKVTYNSPGMDINLPNTTAYAYDMRIAPSGTDISTLGPFLLATRVGGMPSTYSYNELTEVQIESLNPGLSYNVALRTRDTEGLWSDIVMYGSAVSPTVDAQAPMFFGADKATAGDEGASVNLWWTAAEDHSMYNVGTLEQLPIKYNIYLKSVADGILDMADGTGLNSAILWKGAETDFTGTAIELNGTYTHSDSGETTIEDNVTYQLGVRACDNVKPTRNCDDNTRIVNVTPSEIKAVQKTISPYTSSTNNVLNKNGTPAGGDQTFILTNTNSLDFVGSTETYPMTYWIDNFVVAFVNDDRTANTITAQLGEWDGSTCNLIALATAQANPALTKGGVQSLSTFKFGAVTKIDAPIINTDSFCIQLSQTGDPIDVFWGSATSRGDASVIEQITNEAPAAITPVSIIYNSANGLVEMNWTHPLTDGDGLLDVDGGDPSKDYDPVHYDIYGDDGSNTFDFVIAEEVDGSVNYYEWDPQASGITSGNLGVRIRPGDGFSHTSGTTDVDFTGLHAMTAFDNVAPAQITDLQVLTRPKKGTVELVWTCPGDDGLNNGRALKFDIRYSTSAITEGNFDAIPQSDADPLSGQVQAPPYPDFGDHTMEFEVTGLTEGQNYYFAVKTLDEQLNASELSLAKYVNSDQAEGGPRCGMCHATGPNILESQGNHKLHGYTLNDCNKCHTVDPGGAGEIKVSDYALSHQDGYVRMGYGPEGAVEGVVTGSGNSTTITYTDTVAGFDMYVDTNGFGGFGQQSDQYNTAIGFGKDDGSCFNFGAMGVGGCHGPAGSDPDDAGTEYPLFETPNWSASANLDCGRCHGNPNRDDNVSTYPITGYKLDPYGRDYDGTLFNPDGAGIVPDQILGSPGADNRGGYDAADPDVDKRALIGQHEKHLNYSYRFTGDSCSLCHKGHYDDINNLDGRHGNGIVDIELDTAAAGTDAHYNSGTAGVIAGQCFSMDPYSCHPNNATPEWDSNKSFDCIGCHTMQGDIDKIGHYTDEAAGIDNNTIAPDGDPTNTLDGGPMLGNCTWCHFAGHPTDNVSNTALILPNNPQVGINYKSGGIHLRKQPGGTGPIYQTQAELCWGCHDTQSSPAVSEWGADDGVNNAAETKQTGRPDYDYGMLTGGATNWIGAEWNSAQSTAAGGSGMFDYKMGKLQSYHTTNLLDGSSEITYNTTRNQYEETVNVDTVDEIQCHNCHDVHNMNFAKNDQMNGQPYLRGSWLSNPYPEDGAPRPSSLYTSENLYGNVPRGGVAYNNMGGFQIDQNNLLNGNPPTKGFGLGNSAGLCTLCHGADVDNMDNLATNGENLWLGANGHSNAALGGTAKTSQVKDILSYNIRNYSDPVDYTGQYGSATAGDILPAGPGNPNMGYDIVNASSATEYAGGFRSARSNGWQDWFIGGATLNGVKSISNPDLQTGAINAFVDFDWGVSQDSGGIINKGYHAFSCSKCHTPHASRLPKLLITNCLDTKQNTWDDSFDDTTGDTPGWNLPAASVLSNESRVLSQDNALKTPSNFTSAQNCHRLSDPGQAGVAPPAAGSWNGPGGSTQYGGWNKVTPWTAPLP